jgi:hypothetical protein
MGSDRFKGSPYQLVAELFFYFSHTAHRQREPIDSKEVSALKLSGTAVAVQYQTGEYVHRLVLCVCVCVLVCVHPPFLQGRVLSCIYRASRDGWTARQFHQLCDLKVLTTLLTFTFFCLIFAYGPCSLSLSLSRARARALSISLSAIVRARAWWL